MSTGPTPPAVALLEVSGLDKSYATGSTQIDVLQGLDLRVERGEMVAVLGVSGTGKTTLLNILGLMDRPDDGTYRFDGIDVPSLPEEERSAFRNHRCGFVFQAHHLLPEFSALENASLPLWIRQEAPEAARSRASEILERLGLADRMHHRPAQLSAGEQQRVALARAFVGAPDLILADEPTGNLDPTTADRVFDLFLDVHRREGSTAILVTHNPDLARRCGRALELVDGRLVPAPPTG